MNRITITRQGGDGAVLTTGSAAEIARTTGAVLEIRSTRPDTDRAVVVKVFGRLHIESDPVAFLSWPRGAGDPEHAIALSDALAIAVSIVRTANQPPATAGARTAWDGMPTTGGFSAGRD